jgi:transposase
VLVWDGEAAATHAFRGVLGAKVVICNPADPEAKGLVERANGYLETSFLPGRSFDLPVDFNAQLSAWTAVVNTRRRRVPGCAPTDRIGADRAAMVALPPVPPATGWATSLRLPRDHYVRLDGNDYSVHPEAVGRRIEVTADLDRVRVACEGRVVGDHARVWARHQTLTDPAHRAAGTRLRAEHAATAGAAKPCANEVEERALTDYDTAFGLGEGPGDGQGGRDGEVA